MVLKSEKKSAYMNTYFLVRHNNHIATWHQITRETWIWSENSKGCWLVNFLENKNMIRNDSNILWKRSPYLLSTIYCLGERLISCWRNRRIGVCTQRQGSTSVVLEFTIIAHLYKKKISQSLCISKKRFLKDRIIYTHSL